MLDEDDMLKNFISDVLNPTSENIDHDKLERFLLEFVDKMKERSGAFIKMSEFDGDVKRLIGICLKMWNEKESWKDMYYKMYERYSKHLDDEISQYHRILGS